MSSRYMIRDVYVYVYMHMYTVLARKRQKDTWLRHKKGILQEQSDCQLAHMVSTHMCTCTCTSRTAALTSMPGRRVCTGTRLSPGMREEKTVLGLTETGTDLASGPAHTTHCNTCPRHNGFPRLRSLTNSAAFFLSKKPVLLWIPKATMYPWSSTLCTQQGRTWGGGDTGTVCINKKSFVFKCCCRTVFIVYSIFVRISFHSVCMRLRLAVCMYMCMHEGLVNAEQRMVYSYNQIARGTCMKLPAIAACS